ncbi:MAG: biotin-dependent carboxyltransferase family protein [Desulfobacterales bacterium]|jgi:antagonist of KipI
MAAVKSIEVLSPGLQTTIQDLGRFGYGHYGVPPSGALDSFSSRIANRLVDNSENSACLETTLMGLRLKALTDICVAVTGADLQLQINRQPLKMWCSHLVKKGDILSFGGPRSGCRAYIAFGGGIIAPPVLGSRSTNLFSGFGGIKGRSLQKGDRLSIDSPEAKLPIAGRLLKSEWIPQYPSVWTLRVVWGPQDNDFTSNGKRTLTHTFYRVSPESDRSGIRLEGAEIRRKRDAAESIISEGLISGSIQVPGDGKPIIILGETVSGGYRKIATVITADLHLLGQIKPGDQIQFAAVSLEEARCALDETRRCVNDFSVFLYS